MFFHSHEQVLHSDGVSAKVRARRWKLSPACLGVALCTSQDKQSQRLCPIWGDKLQRQLRSEVAPVSFQALTPYTLKKCEPHRDPWAISSAPQKCSVPEPSQHGSFGRQIFPFMVTARQYLPASRASTGSTMAEKGYQINDLPLPHARLDPIWKDYHLLSLAFHGSTNEGAYSLPITIISESNFFALMPPSSKNGFYVPRGWFLAWLGYFFNPTTKSCVCKER